MTESEGLSFVIKPLECRSLDGAFRVQLPLESFEQLNFKLGDVCRIVENGAVRGYGLAWRATDRMGNAPRAKPAKISDYLKTVLNVKDGSNVTISRASRQILPAAKITLSDVTPTDYGQTEEDTSDDVRWARLCGAQLDFCEAITTGTTFDVYVRKGLRRRFRIRSIESQNSEQTPAEAQDLYHCDKKTAIIISANSADLPDAPETFGKRLAITADRIGGLHDQLLTLNKHISAMLKRTPHPQKSRTSRPSNEAILIHGYEGTGKSLVLNQLETAGFRQVFRITPFVLTGSTVAKNKAMIKDAFDAVRTTQRSLILLDDMDELAPKGDNTYAHILLQELKNLPDTQVLVVGACRSPSDLNSKLLDEDCFPVKIELPTPDVHSRKGILDVILRDQRDGGPDVRQSLALRTHGFTGRDLRSLCDAARRNCFVYRDSEEEAAASSHLDGQNSGDTSEGLLNATTIGNASAYTGDQSDADESEEELTQEDWDIALKETRPSALREIFFEKPQVQWSDIGGSQNMKKHFDETIGWPIHHPEKYKMHGVVPKKGILLYGPPGCSKTLTAQAVASTYDLNFIAVQGAELISKYVGESERSVRELFRKARAASPCVVFFDEIDSIASERDSGGTQGLNVLTTLLNEMDGFKSLSNVLVLAATNKPEALDPAIMRPGRFDSHVYLGPPSAEARREIFALSTRGLTVGDDVNFAELVDKTEGYTGAEVVQICNHAKEDSLRRDMTSESASKDLIMADFVQAIENTAPSVQKELLRAYEGFGRRV